MIRHDGWGNARCLYYYLLKESITLIKIRVAQRKRGGPITHRSQDRNLALIQSSFPLTLSKGLFIGMLLHRA
ncbi:unnamed protein product [Spirodela intermedia]|uniref:Uncharacterized protein n=1 Tax=Spirodela intermedia TaxID=51605 RepID=A0A7I8KTM8_SPIIN|nr:unnamed protein product [Spirodela intermedia]